MPNGAIDVLDTAASGAHRVMVIVIDAGLIPGGGVGCFDSTQQPQGGEISQHHVHGLHSDFRQFDADAGGDILGGGVRGKVDRSQNRETLTRHPTAVGAQGCRPLRNGCA